ncbi:MAG: ABC transporter ATP-binding protein [Magnetococcales bacterium]|nr:ABC transporter ATP-binding protein [Magnetococcales bacterium]
MLRVESIAVHYGDMQAIWEVSFEVLEGEIVVLLGSNGAGKSTIIKTISGLLSPTSGTITLGDIRLDQEPADRIIHHGVVQVPEGRRLFGEMSVEENLIMGSLAPAAKIRRQETMEEVYELFPQLKDRRKQAAGTLSGGEQQMVAVGRGLMALPKILMLDEPSLGLSPLMVNDLFRIIEKINEQGVTVLLVEQNVHHSLAVCHRAYVLENGRNVITGTGLELAENAHIKESYLGLGE